MKSICTCPFEQMSKHVEFFCNFYFLDVTGSSVGAPVYELPQISQPVALGGWYLKQSSLIPSSSAGYGLYRTGITPVYMHTHAHNKGCC